MYSVSLITILISTIFNSLFEKIYSTLINQSLTTATSQKQYSYKNYKISSENFKYLYYN